MALVHEDVAEVSSQLKTRPTSRPGSSSAGLIDSGTVLYRSTRTWQDQLDDHHILYSPDKRGLPVVVDARAAAALASFSGGAAVESVVTRLRKARTSLDEGSTLKLIRFFHQRSFLRFKEDSARYEARDLAGLRPSALSIWLHINNHCNLDCSYCFVDKSDSIAEMSHEIIDKTISLLVATIRGRKIQRFTLKIAGGEPTLSIPRMESFHDKLQEALAHESCRWSTAVLSNGTVMSARLIRFLQRPNVGISVSVDGYGPAGHDIFRVFRGGTRGSWSLIERNIAIAMDHGITPFIMATISQESSKTLPDLVRWIFGQGLRVRLSIVRQPQSRQAYSAFQSSAVRRSLGTGYDGLIADVIRGFEGAFEELERDSYEIDLRNALRISELHFDSPSFTSCCGIGHNHLVINEMGEVASCPMTLHQRTRPASSDMLESVSSTFSEHSPLDRKLTHGKNCLDCRWFPVCVSGCPINNLAVNGRPYSVSPLNPFYEYVIPRYIRFFGRKLVQAARRRGIREFLALAP